MFFFLKKQFNNYPVLYFVKLRKVDGKKKDDMNLKIMKNY